jgi:hypothetical protein
VFYGYRGALDTRKSAMYVLRARMGLRSARHGDPREAARANTPYL